jgi:hypothetical protein
VKKTTRSIAGLRAVAVVAVIAGSITTGAAAAGAAPPTVIATAAGFDHNCALTSGGGVLCWGHNELGQLGDTTNTDRWLPVGVSGLLSGVTAITAGGDHSCAVTAGGGVKCWGDNFDGALGDTTNTDRARPVDVAGLTSGVTAVSAGAFHTCALTSAGGVKCWGLNDHGQLGNNSFAPTTSPVDVVGLASGVVAISAGGRHTCALTSAGAVKCWGHDGFGQLGDNGAVVDSAVPVSVVGLSSGVAAISAGGRHTCALTTGTGMKCWGRNDFGQLGNTNRLDSYVPGDVFGLTAGVASIAAGRWHTCAVLTGSGAVKCWGSTDGTGDVGDARITSPQDVPGLSGGIVSLGAGEGHTCAVTTAGGVKCFGNDFYGKLGDGGTTGTLTAVNTVFVTVSKTSDIADFDGNHTSEVSVFRPSAGQWFVKGGSPELVSYGAAGDVSVLADYDGDRKADVAIFRPATGLWAIHRSTGGDVALTYGIATDIPVPGDYDGDGKDDVAVFRPDTGGWFVHRSSTNTDVAVTYGINGDVAVPADYDGDHVTDIAVFRPSAGTWFVHKSTGGDVALAYGATGDVPVPGDYDGDGLADIAVFRPSTGLWAEHRSGGTDFAVTYGFGSDIPAPADYDGDAKTDVGIFRPASGGWYTHSSSTGADSADAYGINGDVPASLRPAVKLAFF